MSQDIVITKDIELHPKYLDGELKKHILNNLQELKTCSQSYGYILEIKEIKKVESLTISRVTKFPIFRVEIIVNCLLPEVGKILDCTVTTIFQQGLFLEYGPLKLLIPSSSMKGYIYENKTFKKDNMEISVGSRLTTKITALKYEKQMFQCIGCIVEEIK